LGFNRGSRSAAEKLSVECKKKFCLFDVSLCNIRNTEKAVEFTFSMMSRVLFFGIACLFLLFSHDICLLVGVCLRDFYK
jgi:hypothetical protein